MSFRHRHNQSLRYNYSSAPKSPSHQPTSQQLNTKPSSNHPSPRHFNYSTEHLTALPPPTALSTSSAAGGSGTNVSSSNPNASSTVHKTSATCSLASSRESSTSNPGAASYK